MLNVQTSRDVDTETPSWKGKDNGRGGDHKTTKKRRRSGTILQKGDEESVKSLETIQENIESAAEEIAHNLPKKDRDSHHRRLPLKVEMGEAAAAGSSRSTEKKVFRRVARKARAEHLVRCTIILGRKGTGRKPLNNCLSTVCSRKTVQTGKNCKDTEKASIWSWSSPTRSRRREFREMKIG